MSSPEQLDAMLHVTSLRSWVTLTGVGIVIAGGLIWSVFGRMSTKETGKGVMIRAGNVVTVASLGQGRIMDVMVHPSDMVHKGQVIAVVSEPLLQDKIDAARLDLDRLESRKGPQESNNKHGLGLELSAIDSQSKALDKQIAAAQESVDEADAQIAATQDLLNKGLVTRRQVTDLREHKATLMNQIEGYRVQQVQLKGNAYKAEAGDKNSHLESEAKLHDAQNTLHLLLQQNELESKVISPYEGEVLEVQALSGALVSAGSSIVSMQPRTQQMEVVGYIPAVSAKSVKPGMDAEVIPTSIRPEEFGFIRATVSAVADYPATDTDLNNTFQNKSLAQIMTASGPVTEVRLRIHLDPATVSGYVWSSGKGAPLHLTPGTICTVNVLTKEELPIRLLIPYLKQKLGTY